MKEKISRGILFISNGYAEDLIGSLLAEKLHKTLISESFRTNTKEEEYLIIALPLVGKGDYYTRKGIFTIGPRTLLPSEGFATKRCRNLLTDLKAGWLRVTREQIKALRQIRSQVHLVIVVGDFYPVFLSVLFLHRPLIFIPTAKSEYIQPHYLIEKWFLRRCCLLVFPRDPYTAESLRRNGIRSQYVGNAMMDCLTFSRKPLPVTSQSYVVGILPGSRSEAYQYFPTLFSTAQEISKQNPTAREVRFLLALPPSLDQDRVIEIARTQGGEFHSPWKKEKLPGVKGILTFKEKIPSSLTHKMRVLNTRIFLIEGRFGDLVHKSQVVIGLSGTGNEQAVGLGKPVVAFPGKGPQITEKFLHIQQQLLGGAVIIVSPQAKAVAQEVWSLLLSPSRRKEIVHRGQERMGPPGAISRMVHLINETFMLRN